MVTLASFAFEVGLAVSSTPSTETPTYTDISAYVIAERGISVTRGRANEFDVSAQPGQCGLALKNTDGRFTMGNAASPYAPLQIRRPLRVRVTYAGVTYPIFAGFIDSWDNGRDGVSGRATLSASDRLARAERIKLPSAILSEMLADDPDFLFPLTEPAGSTSIGDVAGQIGVTMVAKDWYDTGQSLTATYELGVGVAPGPDSGTVAAFTREADFDGWVFWRYTADNANWGTGTGMTLSAFVRPGNLPTNPDAGYVMGLSSADGPEWQEVHLGVQKYDALYTATAWASGHDWEWEVYLDGTIPISLTEMTYLAIRFTASGSNSTTVDLLVNGVVDVTETYASDDMPWGYLMTIGGSDTTAVWDGQISHAAFYPAAVSTPRLAEHAKALNTGVWWQEDSTARFERLCRNAGLPASHYDTDGTATAEVVGQATANRSLAEVLKDVAEAESGVIYCDRAGVLHLAASTIRYGTTVGLTLDARRAGQTLADTAFTTDDSTLLNDLTVTRQGGPAQRARDAASAAAYDVHDESITLIVTTDDKAAQAAAWRIADRKTPAPRIAGVAVDVVAFANSGGNVANLLNADTGTRLRLMGLPADVSATSTLDQFIEGIAHTIGKDQWIIRFTTSPIGVAENVLILDDTTRGKLDTGILAY